MHHPTVYKHVRQQQTHGDATAAVERVHRHVDQTGRYVRQHEKQQLVPVDGLDDTTSFIVASPRVVVFVARRTPRGRYAVASRHALQVQQEDVGCSQAGHEEQALGHGPDAVRRVGHATGHRLHGRLARVQHGVQHATY